MVHIMFGYNIFREQRREKPYLLLSSTKLEIQMFEMLFRFFIKLQVAVFRRTNGRSMAFMNGMPVLLLTTIGRKSKKERTTPVMYLMDGENYVITASNSGNDHAPGWFYNLQSSPRVTIEVPGRQLQVTASIVPPDEKNRLWAQLIGQAPFFDGYRKRTTREIPMIMLQPVSNIK
jgi:F420H(2)-dependent quinone reductase